MIVKKILNNNTLISQNSAGKQVLLMGKGISFGVKNGDAVPMQRVERSFILQNKDTVNKFTELLIDVPMDHILISEKIINYAKENLAYSLNEIIYVNLTDHINNAINNLAKGIKLKNALKQEVSRFYPDEYAVGLHALNIIKDHFNIELEDDEAAFIAVHFVNAAKNNLSSHAYEITEITKTIEDIVKDFYQTEFNYQSLDYHRFITHLKFFAQRLLTQNYHDEEDDIEFMTLIKNKYRREYECMMEVNQIIFEKFKYQLSLTEQCYLTIHIKKITKNIPKV